MLSTINHFNKVRVLNASHKGLKNNNKRIINEVRVGSAIGSLGAMPHSRREGGLGALPQRS